VQERIDLSSREREVLSNFARGLTYLQIARRMRITVSTVDTYLRRVRAKSGLASGAELVRLAVQLEMTHSETGDDDVASPE
jgi:DNA-binding NarL/FixJ family response regulator